MLREEAIEELKAIKSEYSNKAFGDSRLMRSEIEALDMAIKALEQEPCDYAISRQAAIDAVDIDNLHPGIIGALQSILAELPPATAEPKTGRWIYQKGYVPYKWKCNQCSAKFQTDFNYCPNCGAKMIEPQESEEKNE